MVLWPSEIKQMLLLQLNKAMMIPLIQKWIFALEEEGPFAKKNIQIWVNINFNLKRLGVSNNVDPRINLQIIMYPFFQIPVPYIQVAVVLL